MLKKIEKFKNQKKKHHLLTIKTDQEFKSALCSKFRAMFTLPDAPFDVLSAVLFAVSSAVRSANVFSSNPMKKNDLRKYVK